MNGGLCMNNYDYGPNVDFTIRFVGDMELYNGTYEDRSEKDKYLVQVLCHAIYQIKDILKTCKAGIYYYEDIFFHWIARYNREDSYSVYTRSGMTVLHVVETGYHSFDVEFLSTKQLSLYGDSLLDLAYQHVMHYGRTE